ncbi:MAG: transglutaminase-like domain-containing protein [Lachnospiraceae bacterium]|nr:transglutaminase-like domain-containing protein [Lachnospiraceae bacterium]
MRRIGKVLAALIMAAVFVVSPLENVAYLGSASQVETVYAAQKTITVKKANDSTAKKLHKAIIGGKGVTLKVKGNQSKAYKLLMKLEKKVQKVNGQAVLFDAYRQGEKGGYTYYEITSDLAKEYKYANKFVKKLYKTVRGLYDSQAESVTNALKSDFKKYPDETTRKHHIMYDMCVRFAKDYPAKTYQSYTLGMMELDVPFTVNGGDQRTTEIVGVVKDVKPAHTPLRDSLISLVKSTTENEDGSITLELKSFSEFENDVNKAKVEISNLWLMYFSSEEPEFKSAPQGFKNPKKAFRVTMTGRQEIIFKAKNFYDLSDAMKIWVIDASDYFGCHFYKHPFGMQYSYNGGHNGSGWVLLKNMCDGNVSGVCNDYARLESVIFDEIGITNYVRTNFTISHAWTVVKVKNSKGKTMWIPFDYGIGPAVSLDVYTEAAVQALSTEKKRYKLYLAGIPGAPKKKNFKESDFN